MISTLTDHHTHTPLCHHASGTPEAFLDAALQAGLHAYGIADHAPCLPEPFDDWRMSLDQLPAYLDWIGQAKDHAAGRIPVLAGLECDWLSGCEPWIDTLASRHPWDYLIGSVHYLPKAQKNWDFDNPVHLSHWQALNETDLTDLWTHYWKQYQNMASSGLFQILAHPDLIKKFRPAPRGDLRPYYEPVIHAIAQTNAAIELNTSGWHKPCAEQYPSIEFLQLAAQAGIPLVISSDTHHPSEVARDFTKAVHIAKAAGYKSTIHWQARTPITHPFPNTMNPQANQ